MWKTPLFDTSKLTVELREIVESGVDIWAFDYPSFYKDKEKKAFEQKVINHFFFRQIGQETVGRWLHYFRSRMCEIMPYYIQLYESAALMAAIDDPFGNVDIVETFEQSSTSESQSSGSSEHKGSNTPQGSIKNLDKYMTDAAVDSSDASGSSESNVRHTFTKKGNQGVNTYAHDMKELRDTFLNIDMMVIHELQDLFLQVY